jgi:spermidine synthase
MARTIEELDAADTPIGVISLRRRYEPVTRRDVYEVKLDDAFLMSSLFTVAEEELARLGLARIGDTSGDLHVLVGGLGLGYTLRAALQDERVRQVQVIEAVEAVIDWHRRDLLPDTVGLAASPRCELVHGDFFALVASGETPRPAYDAVLLDVDHSPQNLLHHSHGAFYSAEGLARLAAILAPAGVFGLWSDDPPDSDFEAVLDDIFEQSTTQVVSFANPLTGGESANTVYIANV